MLEKVKQMLAALLRTVESMGDEKVDTVKLTHEYIDGDDSTMMSVLLAVDFKLEPKPKKPAEQGYTKDGEVH